MMVKTLVGSEGDITMDAALNDLGLWREDRVMTFPVARFCGRECGSLLPAQTVYDDGLCSGCRAENDAYLFLHWEEGNRLMRRVSGMFPKMSAGQVIAMAGNLLRQSLGA